MGSGNHNFGAAFGSGYFNNVNFGSFAVLENFAGDLFGFKKESFVVVNFKSYASANDIGAYNGCGNDFVFAALEFFKNLASFCFADALFDNVFCGLCSNSAEFLGFKRNVNNVAKLSFFVVFKCFVDEDLVCGVFNFLNNKFSDCNVKSSGFGVDYNFYVFGADIVAADSNCDCVFDFFAKVFNGNSFFFFKKCERFKKFCVHFFIIPPQSLLKS